MVCLTGFSFWYLYCMYSSKITGAEAKPGGQGSLSSSCCDPCCTAAKARVMGQQWDTGFWDSRYVISPCPLALKG